MNEMVNLTFALLGGLSLGALFFGGLWWTVRRSLSAPNSTFWLFGSMMIRVSAVLTGFYFVGRGDWARMLACLVGFLLARLAIVRLMPAQESAMLRQPEASHAPESG